MLWLFIAAIALTVWNRLLSWWHRGNTLSPTHLQHSIVVVAVVSPGESVEPYVRLYSTAKWSSRVSLRIFKMLGPQEVAPAAYAVPPSALRITQRYGSFDRANERMRILRDGSVGGAEYTLVLAEPVESLAGWDELLLSMYRQCKRSEVATATILTSIPPVSHVSVNVGGTYLCVHKTGAIQSRPFAVPPSRPQPSLFASHRMCFGLTEVLREAAADYGVNTANEDMIASQSLWMAGASLFAPHFSVFYSLHASPHAVSGATAVRSVRKVERAWQPNSNAVRTPREWAHFCNKKSRNTWGRRAQLGLTPGATHEERYAKHGDALQLHGL